MKNKLYIVEGLPCSGKSTIGRYVAELIQGKYVDEGTGNHPADYEFQSFISYDEYNEISLENKEKMKSHLKEKYNGYVVELSHLTEEKELFDYLLQHKIYDFLPWNVEKKVMLDKWQEFAENSNKEIYVFNCVLLQNPMCETMMRFGFDESVSFEYISEIVNILKDYEVIVIYLKNDYIRESVEKAVPERGEEWLNAVIDYHVNGKYGQEHKLEGFDGYIKALQERQERELRILEKLSLNSIVLDNPQKDWDSAKKLLREILINESRN